MTIKQMIRLRRLWIDGLNALTVPNMSTDEAEFVIVLISNEILRKEGKEDENL